MIIHVPDPHPGRCRNLRPSRYHGAEMLRCLDYDGVEHVCTFPPEREPSIHARGWGNFSSATADPKPWVKPVQNGGSSG